MDNSKVSNSQRTFYSVAISASSASILSVLAGYPFDTIKTRMQAYSYPSSINCINQTYKTEGFHGFFRGVTPVLISVSALRSVSFSLYSSLKEEMDRLIPTDLSVEQRLGIIASVSGCFTGSILGAINSPIEFIKVQRQLEALGVSNASGSGSTSHLNFSSTNSDTSTSTKKFSSTFGWFKRIVAQKGFCGLYIGSTLHIVRDGLGTSIYFLCYEMIKHFFTVSKNGKDSTTKSNSLTHLISGGLAGVGCWLVIYPIDSIKSVVQKEALSPNPAFKNGREYVRIALKTTGISRFYSGITPQLMRAFPVHALNFLVYEKMRSLLDGKI